LRRAFEGYLDAFTHAADDAGRDHQCAGQRQRRATACCQSGQRCVKAEVSNTRPVYSRIRGFRRRSTTAMLLVPAKLSQVRRSWRNASRPVIGPRGQLRAAPERQHRRCAGLEGVTMPQGSAPRAISPSTPSLGNPVAARFRGRGRQALEDLVLTLVHEVQ
jgi:hypothetical protein